MTTGGVRCWGANESGQLGDGTTQGRFRPAEDDVLTGVKAIVVGEAHSCALMMTGGVRCWGNNKYGQLFSNPGENQLSPPTIDTQPGTISLAAGLNHTCVAFPNQEFWCQGDTGLAAQPVVPDPPNPIHVVPLPPALTATIYVNSFAAGGDSTCALTPSYYYDTAPLNCVRCWGAGSLDAIAYPYCFETVVTPARFVATGGTHACSILVDNSLTCWGDDSVGQLGDGTTSSVQVQSTLHDVRSAALGTLHTCALTMSGGVRCWGDGSSGQLGDGTTNRKLPVPVPGTCSSP